MDKVLDTFEHRMEFELSLNATQTAHARQILSDLMDVLKPEEREGELVPCDEDVVRHGMRFLWDMASKAQLAHNKATMVKIEWLFEACPHSTDILLLATRRECDKCMEELLSLPKK